MVFRIVIFPRKLTYLPKIRYLIFTKIEHVIPNFDFKEHGIPTKEHGIPSYRITNVRYALDFASSLLKVIRYFLTTEYQFAVNNA